MTSSKIDPGKRRVKKVVAVNNIGAVSPATRPTPRMQEVKMPGKAAGITTFFMVCHRVAPRAREEER